MSRSGRVQNTGSTDFLLKTAGIIFGLIILMFLIVFMIEFAK